MVCGPVGLGASPNVRPTSVDHPKESEYLSEAVFIFDCFKDSRILRLRFPFFLTGGFAAMGLKASLGVDVFNRFASFSTRVESETLVGMKGETFTQWPFHQAVQGGVADRG